MREFGLEGEIIEEAARLHAKAAFQPRPFRSVGEAFAKGEVHAQASEERDLSRSKHECNRHLPVRLIPEMTEPLTFQFDPIAAKREVRAGNRD